MAWTTMHFAVGMGCTGVAATLGCALLKRGWRWIPAAMTAGGFWALLPDLPRIFREDIYIGPLTHTLGRHDLERWLHSWGDLFFFHKMLDAQPKEFALHGLIAILLMYNAAVLLLMALEHKHRNSLANRAWRAHRTRQARAARKNKTRPATPAPPDETAHPPAVLYRIHPNQSTGTTPDRR